jgi:N-acylneuraminate cytidylyltransferase
MKWVALMPLRGGSRAIPSKNVKRMAGRPLFAWSLEAAVESGCFDEIYVATDSPEIRSAVAREFPARVHVIGRPAETATDTASTESVMLHFQTQVGFDVLCLIQATSPLTRADDFRQAKRQFLEEGADSLLTAVDSRRFYWTRAGSPLNYDPANRPRRQQFAGLLMENGAFYFTRAPTLRTCRARLGGKIAIYRMAEETGVEVDEPIDWLVAEHRVLERMRPSGRLADRCRGVRVLAVDVDGTLTDGGMYYGPDGEILKKFDTRDAKGLARLQARGIRVVVLTGEDSPAVAARMKKLEIAEYYPAVADKLALLQECAGRWGVALQAVAYVGDDVGDLECLRAVGLPCCPADAVPEIRRQVEYVCVNPGGRGAVREVCDLILDALPGDGGTASSADGERAGAGGAER